MLLDLASRQPTFDRSNSEESQEQRTTACERLLAGSVDIFTFLFELERLATARRERRIGYYKAFVDRLSASGQELLDTALTETAAGITYTDVNYAGIAGELPEAVALKFRRSCETGTAEMRTEPQVADSNVVVAGDETIQLRATEKSTIGEEP